MYRPPSSGVTLCFEGSHSYLQRVFKSFAVSNLAEISTSIVFMLLFPHYYFHGAIFFFFNLLCMTLTYPFITSLDNLCGFLFPFPFTPVITCFGVFLYANQFITCIWYFLIIFALNTVSAISPIFCWAPLFLLLFEC